MATELLGRKHIVSNSNKISYTAIKISENIVITCVGVFTACNNYNYKFEIKSGTIWNGLYKIHILNGTGTILSSLIQKCKIPYFPFHILWF